MKIFILLSISLITQLAFGASQSKITYFSCLVKEPAGDGKTIDVTVKFAIKGFDFYHDKGELIQYPGSDEDAGAISVNPSEFGKGKARRVTLMTNLNGQGGDLRLEGRNLRLWGDGDGYQFTDLVIWDPDDENDNLEGYVRDYGDTYGDSETFKAFIKCQRSEDKPL